MIKITHKRQECIGCGLCSAECPDLFEMNNDDGLITLKNSRINKDGLYETTVESLPCSEEALKNCPLDLIHIEKI